MELTGGSFLYGRALLAGSPQVGGGNLLYGLEVFHNDGPWDHADDYRRVNAVLRYTRSSQDATWGVTAMGYYGLWDSTDQIPLRAVETGQIDRFGAIDPTTGGKSHRFSLSGDYQQALGAGLLQANVYAVKYRLNLFSNFTYFLDDPVNGDQIEQADNRWIFGTSGRYAWNASADSISLHATVGWEARHDRIDTIGLYDTAAQQRLGTVRQDAVRETSGSLFAEAELTPTRWLRFLAGSAPSRGCATITISSTSRATTPRTRGATTPAAPPRSSRRSSAPGPGPNSSPTSGSGSIPTTPAA